MCFIIAIVLAILAFNGFMAGNLALGGFSAIGSLLFIVLMIRNIMLVRRERQNRKEDL